MRKLPSNKPKEAPPLSVRAIQFVDLYLADPEKNATRACAMAGFSARTAPQHATLLLKDPRIKALIAEKTGESMKRLQLSADDVLRDIYNVATADVRNIISYHVGACRHCWGTDFKYHYRPAEYATELERYLKDNKDRDPLGLDFPVGGGVGYSAKRKPNPECPECDGEGIGRTVISDTRTLTPTEQVLFAGVKETRHGIEVLTRSKDKAIELAARHTGVVKNTMDIGNKDGKPFTTAGLIIEMSAIDAVAAAAEYTKIMGGK